MAGWLTWDLQADFVRNGNSKQIMSLSKEHTTALWDAVQDSEYHGDLPSALPSPPTGVSSEDYPRNVSTFLQRIFDTTNEGGLWDQPLQPSDPRPWLLAPPSLTRSIAFIEKSPLRWQHARHHHRGFRQGGLPRSCPEEPPPFPRVRACKASQGSPLWRTSD